MSLNLLPASWGSQGSEISQNSYFCTVLDHQHLVRFGLLVFSSSYAKGVSLAGAAYTVQQIEIFGLIVTDTIKTGLIAILSLADYQPVPQELANYWLV